MKIIEDLKWRYATKKYDTTKSISDKDFETIKEAIQLAPTSYGLQLFKVLEIDAADVKQKLVPASWGQEQANTTSKYLVFCVPKQVTAEMIDEYVEIKAQVNDKDPELFAGYADFMKMKVLALSNEDAVNWMNKQVYIALGVAISAAASLRIDSTPMEGFEADKYATILDLKQKGLTAAVVLALGYRSSEDITQHDKKARRPIKDLFIQV